MCWLLGLFDYPKAHRNSLTSKSIDKINAWCVFAIYFANEPPAYCCIFARGCLFCSSSSMHCSDMSSRLAHIIYLGPNLGKSHCTVVQKSRPPEMSRSLDSPKFLWKYRESTDLVISGDPICITTVHENSTKVKYQWKIIIFVSITDKKALWRLSDLILYNDIVKH